MLLFLVIIVTCLDVFFKINFENGHKLLFDLVSSSIYYPVVINDAILILAY